MSNEINLSHLEKWVKEIIKAYEFLKNENDSLKDKNTLLLKEKNLLLQEKNFIFNKVSTLINKINDYKDPKAP